MQRNNIKEICNVKLLHIFRFTVYLLVNPAFCRIRLVKELGIATNMQDMKPGKGTSPFWHKQAETAQNRTRLHIIDFDYLLQEAMEY